MKIMFNNPISDRICFWISRTRKYYRLHLPIGGVVGSVLVGQESTRVEFLKIFLF